MANLLWHLPTGMVDRRQVRRVAGLVEGQIATVLLKVGRLTFQSCPPAIPCLSLWPLSPALLLKYPEKFRPESTGFSRENQGAAADSIGVSATLFGVEFFSGLNAWKRACTECASASQHCYLTCCFAPAASQAIHPKVGSPFVSSSFSTATAGPTR